VGKDTFLAQIVKLVTKRTGSKAPIQRLADQVAGWFVPAVIAIAIATFIIWSFMGNVTLALITTVGVLVLLVLVPWVCNSDINHGRYRKGAENGILIKGAD